MIRSLATLPQTTVGRLRLGVIAAAFVATVTKLILAAKTTGTDDVYLFGVFARQVHKFGPVGIYGAPPEVVAPYNHPPLVGWALALFNFLSEHGVAFTFLIRVPATLADFVTTIVLFELIRSRRPVREAAIGAALFAFSPALGVISGFHGNTDPVAIMFTLLAFYLLVIRNAPAWAGISLAVGLSVKLVPIVFVPLLAFVALRAGWRQLAKFGVSGAAVMALLWTAPLVSHFSTVRTNVIGYAGYGPRQWGLPQFAVWLGLPNRPIEVYAGSGRFLVLAVCALVPVLIAWRWPHRTIPAAALPLAGFLLLSPAHAMQYTIWPVAALYLANIWAATAFSWAAGLLLLKVYSRWNGAPPWHWGQAWSTGMDPLERKGAALVWLVLLISTIVAVVPRFTKGSTVDSVADSDVEKEQTDGTVTQMSAERVTSPVVHPIDHNGNDPLAMSGSATDPGSGSTE